MHFGRFILAMMNLTLNEYGQNRKSNGTWKKLKKQVMAMKYDKLTDVFSVWADAAAGKSMPRWEEYDKVIRKRYGADIDTEQDLFDVIGRK